MEVHHDENSRKLEVDDTGEPGLDKELETNKDNSGDQIDLKDNPNKCDQCGENFESFNEVMAHIKANHEPYCGICKVRYKDFKNLRSHKRLYHQPESEEFLFCEECGKRCKNKNLLNQHKSFVHKRVENLNCNLCGKPCANMAKLRKHTKKCLTREDFESLYRLNMEKKSSETEPHAFINNLSPQEDLKSNPTEVKYDESEQQNNEDKETLLDYGALAFLSRDSNIKDENTEPELGKDKNKNEDTAKDELVEVKEEGEDSDSQEFDSQGNFSQADYMKMFLPTSYLGEKQLYTCHCGAVVKNLKQHHKRQHMRAPEKESICEECGKIFSKAVNLKAHIKSVHSGDPQECPECGVKVLNLKQHTRRQHKRNSDTGELESECICNHCGKIFDKSSKLKGHIATVHTQNESICHICSKEFKNPHYLRCHIRVVHSSNETVTCDQCHKTYTSKQKLYHHQRAVHTLEDARCEACGKSYKNRDLLKKHQRLYHPVINTFSNQSLPPAVKTDWNSPVSNQEFSHPQSLLDRGSIPPQLHHY